MMSLLVPWVLVLSWVVPSATQEGAGPGTQQPTQQQKPAPPVALPAEPKPAPAKPAPPVALPAEPKPLPLKPTPPVAPPVAPKPAPARPSPPVALPAEPKPVPPIAAPAEQPSAAPAPLPAVPNVAAPSPERLSPDQLRHGPSLFETGRVGKMGVGDSGVQIKQNRVRSMPQELPVENKIDEGGTPAPAHTGVVNAAILKREIRSRFALLRDCPVQVARTRKASSESINASRLTLRWTILPGGKVADTQVVATAPTDGHVMDCVKREMSQWSFTPPRGGPVRVERPFKFRPAAAATAPTAAAASDQD